MAISLFRRRISYLLVLSLITLLGLAAVASYEEAGAQPVTVNVDLPPSADTFVRLSSKNANEGASPFLFVSPGNQHRALLAIDGGALSDASTGGELVSATLKLTVVSLSGNWQQGHEVSLHQLTTAWEEGNGFSLAAPRANRGSGSGATWNCAVDENLANYRADCSGETAWEMGPTGEHPWLADPTASAVIDGDTESVAFDVTADVAALLNGGEHHGWLLMPGQGGSATVVFGSRENAGHQPALELVFNSTPPSTTADSYAVTGNVGIDVAAPGLFANDALNGAVLDSFDAVSLAGGDVAVSPEGSFTYIPPAGFNGTDSFSYTIANIGGAATGMVELTVGDMVWFVDNSAPDDGDGRLGTPFNSLESLSSNAAPGDAIFLFAGSGDYTGGITLLDNQALVGQGADLASSAGFALAPDSALPDLAGNPVLSNDAGDGVTLGNENSLHGFDIGDTAGTGIAGADFGTLTIGTLSVTGGGTVAVLEDGILDADLTSASSDGGEFGISLDDVSGTFSVSGGTISGAAHTAVHIENVQTPDLLTVTLSGMTLRDSGDNGLSVVLEGNSQAEVTIDGGTLTDNHTDGVQAHVDGTASLDLSVLNSTVTGSHVAIDIGTETQATVVYAIEDNVRLESDGASVINVFTGESATTTGVVSGNADISEAPGGNGIWIVQEGDGSAVVSIADNAISGIETGNGIALHTRHGSGSLDATVTNNTITPDPAGLSGHGIAVQSGNAVDGETSRVCINYQGNSSDGGPDFSDYFLEQLDGTTFEIEGLVPASGANEAEVEAFVADANSAGTAEVAPAGNGVVVEYTAATCATP